MHQRGWIEVDNAQMPFRRNRNQLSRKNNHPRGRQASKGKHYKLPRKNQIPEIQKGLAKLPWIPQLLKKLNTETVRKISSLLSTTQEGRAGLSDIGVNRTIQRNQ